METMLYQPLAANELRVLRIQAPAEFSAPIVCTLRKETLGRSPGMFALSYVWGDLNDTVPISLNGFEFKVTTNLAAALRRLRSSPFGPDISQCDIWVDALCINQSDVDERNQQVQLMGAIYKQAVCVIAFLGEAENESDLAMKMIEEWGENSKGLLDPSSDFKPTVNLFEPEAWKALPHLFGRPFWRRIWIQQEMALGKQIFVNCGPWWVRWEAMDSALRTWRKLEKPDLSDAIKVEQLKMLGSSGYRMLVDIVLCRQYRSEGKSDIDILELLRMFSKKEASDPRDKIYAIIGLAGAEHSIVPDYSRPVEEIYKSFARQMIERQQSLRVIYAAEAGTSNLTKLPSWTPDWSVHDPSNRLRPIPPIGLSEEARGNYGAAKNTKSVFSFSEDGNILFARGTICDRVSLKSPDVTGGGLYSTEGKKTWQSFIFSYGDSIHPSGMTPLQAFFRTILIDFDVLSATRLQIEEPTFFDLASAFLCSLAYIGSNPKDGQIKVEKSETQYDYLNGLLKFSGVTEEGRSPQALLEIFLGTSNSHLAEKWTNGDLWRGFHSFSSYINWCASVTSSRRLFWTAKGYMGLGPLGICENDLVCVLLGSSVPVLLRRIESHYILVGECFALGLMDGEALQDTEGASVILEDFEIH